MTRVLPLLLALSACDPSGALDLYLPIHVAQGVEDYSAHLESIEGVWGLEVREVPPSLCAVTLHPRPPGPVLECERDGMLRDDGWFQGCRRDVDQIWCAEPAGDNCAHELGHVAQLNHRQNPRNVMTPGILNRTGRADDDQIAAVEALAWAYAACRRIRDRSDG